MELKAHESPDLVVALDIGSTNSGYAWQWRGNFENNRSNIEFNENWGTPSPKLRKTTTCLLLNEGKEVDSFGQLAEKRFSKECDKAKGEPLDGKWYFFKNFKIMLYNQTDPGKMQIDDQFGQVMPLLYVMSKFIQALKEHFLHMMKGKGQRVNLQKTRWVITVPAIWSDGARNFMRLAAEMAGLNKSNMLIAHEPEAAALHCIHLPQQEKIAMGNFGEKGDTFLTVDLGGGTTDVQALRVRDDGKLEEVILGSGGLVGGRDINNAFFQACNDAFEGGVWQQVTNNSHAVELFEMENDFESKKVSIGIGESGDESMSLQVPLVFMNLLREEKLRLKSDANTRFELKENKMYFTASFIKQSLFNETIQRMLDFLREILKRDQVESVKHVILVGGFTEAPLVVEKIRDFLQKNFPGREVIVPTSPLSAVMSGAVLFGHDPLIFKSRICRATYGVQINARFDSKLHRMDKKWKNNESGIEYCKDIFNIHVTKGSSLKLGETLPSKSYFPVYKTQTILPIPIFMSTEEHLRGTVYTTDEHCKKLGEITVEMPDTTGGTSRKVTVTMIYGGTELAVTAKNETSGKEFNATLQFDTY